MAKSRPMGQPCSPFSGNPTAGSRKAPEGLGENALRVQKNTLSNTDLEVSALALGTMHLGGTWDESPVDSATIESGCELIDLAIELGINHLDLADIYTFGKSESVVGEYFKRNPQKRDGLVLQAKCGIILDADPAFGPPKRYDFSHDHIIKSVETTLQRLGTDRVEILALHRPDPLVEFEEVARAFHELRESGKVLHFGVSNHSRYQMELLQSHLSFPLVVNQMEVSLKHHYLISDGLFVNQESSSANCSGLMEYCRGQQVGLQAWSPVAGGAVFQGELGKAVEGLATRRSTSAEAVALAWLLRHPAQIQPIVGTMRKDRLRAFAEAPQVQLSRLEWYELLQAALGREVP